MVLSHVSQCCSLLVQIGDMLLFLHASSTSSLGSSHPASTLHVFASCPSSLCVCVPAETNDTAHVSIEVGRHGGGLVVVLVVALSCCLIYLTHIPLCSHAHVWMIMVAPSQHQRETPRRLLLDLP